MKYKKWITVVSVIAVLIMVPDSRGVSGNAARLLGNSIADAVDSIMPSVVVIRTEAVNYHMARDRFSGYSYRIPERLAGQGSGVIISEDGYLLTSYHVIAGADKIEVALPDESKYSARLVGVDPRTDLAVLSMEDTDKRIFKAAEFGDSDKVRIGELAIAIGSPFSLESSVTLGIVSQKGRSVGQLEQEDFIQTDAPINPGNSGGPLVNAEGQVIGINAMIQKGGPYSDGNIGIAFAIPANLAMRVAGDLMQGGSVHRPWIGILPAEPGTAIRSLLPSDVHGLIIQHVFNDTPAQKAGLSEGDIITEVDGTAVHTVRDIQRIIFGHQPGDEVVITRYRHGKTDEVTVVTEIMPADND